MTQKVNGAAYPGVWVERKVAFVKLTFDQDIRAIPAADLVVLGTATPAGLGTIADSSFAVVESVMVQALKTLETRATVLGISSTVDGLVYDVMLGNAEGWFAPLTDGIIIPAGTPITAAQAKVTTAGAAPTDVLGATVGVVDGAVTFEMRYAIWDGTMPNGTGANGGVVSGPGATSGATPTNSPTGTPGFYPPSV
jgi:hypothetical protein